MPQTNFLGNVTGVIDPAVFDPLATEVEARQIAEEEASKAAFAVDDTPLALTAVAGNTSYAYNPARPNRETLLNVSTTFSIAPPPGRGWRHTDSGTILLSFDGSNSTASFAGLGQEDYNAVPATKKTTGWVCMCYWQYFIGLNVIVWEFKFINATSATVAKDFYVKGNGTTARITIAHTATSSDQGPITVAKAFKIEASEATGNVQILISKGSGNTGTAQMTIGTNGLLRIGMGSLPEDYVATDDSVLDGVRHLPVLVFVPNTSTANGVSYGTLEAYLDGGLIGTKSIDMPTYNTSGWNVLALSSGYGTHAKDYVTLIWQRKLTAAEVLGLNSGIIPRNGLVVEHNYNAGDATDTSGNNNHGVIAGTPTFGFDTLG